MKKARFTTHQLLAFYLMGTALTSALRAESGNVTTLPPPRFVTANAKPPGLSLTVDSHWIDNYGYRPIRVRINSPTPTTREHFITIRFFLLGWSTNSRQLTVEKDFIVPVGATTAETTVPVPIFHIWNQLWWDVWVDGIKDKNLSLPVDAADQIMLQSQGVGRNWQPNVWILDFDDPTSSIMASGWPMLMTPLPTPQAQPAMNELAGVERYSIAEAPNRWFDYSCVDVVAATPQELTRLAQLRPEAIETLRRWILAGGTLWASDVGESWEELSAIEQLLELPPSAVGAVEQGEAKSSVPSGWMGSAELEQAALGPAVSFVDVETGEIRSVRDERQIAFYMSRPEFMPLDPDFSVEETTRRLRRAERWYIQRSLGFGVVRAYRRDWKKTPAEVAMLYAERWVARHGLAPNESSSEFNNWLVPNVGLAPVTLFQVLITLFVLIIGPLNYFVLHKSGRLHLLIFTVPIAATTFAAGLFCYAILSDGLDTRIRVRSLTMLDQRTGEAANWARISYYAGIAPSQGLALDTSAVYYPILPEATTGFGTYRHYNPLELAWTDSSQQLTRGWLKSRTPTQFLAISAQPSKRRLDIQPLADSLRVTNRLDSHVQFLLVVDQDHQLFGSTDLEPGGKAKVLSISNVDAARQLRRMITDNAPEYPEGYSGRLSDFVRSGRQRNQVTWNRYGIPYNGELLSDNRMNQWFDIVRDSAAEQKGSLQPPFYVAITETAPDLSTGVDDALDESSFHVVIGNW